KASITKLTMEIGGVSKTTKDKSKINELFEHFNQVEYKRMRGDQTAYMPTKAYIIYLHEGDYSDFIVPYNDEAMISYNVYKIKKDEITYEFLNNYYQSLNYLIFKRHLHNYEGVLSVDYFKNEFFVPV